MSIQTGSLSNRLKRKAEEFGSPTGVDANFNVREYQDAYRQGEK